MNGHEWKGQTIAGRRDSALITYRCMRWFTPWTAVARASREDTPHKADAEPRKPELRLAGTLPPVPSGSGVTQVEA